MACRDKLIALLKENKIAYQLFSHKEIYTAQELASVHHISGKSLAKVVIVKADNELIMVVVAAPNKVSLDKIAELLKAENVDLANEKDFKDIFFDCDIGAMPPFGNLYQMKTFIDENLTKQQEIVFKIGSHNETMKIKYSDYEKIAQPIISSLVVAVK